MTRLTDNQWKLYEKKYGRLMRMISLRISGDDAIANPEDNYSDLCIAALESILGFEKKTGKSFDEAMGTKLFDQYTKTVLWNRKAKKGIPLTKRKDFNNRTYSLDSLLASNMSSDSNFYSVVEDSKSQLSLSAVDFDQFLETQSEDVRKVMSAILSNPATLSKEGRVNCSALAKPTGLSVYYVRKAVTKIEKIMGRSCEES